MNRTWSKCSATEAGAPPPTAGLGVYGLDHFVLAVPSLERARPFLDACGLRTRLDGETLKVQAEANEHDWASFVQGPRKKLRRLSFAAYPDDLTQLRARAVEAGRVLIEDAEESFALSGPDGLEVQIIARDRSQISLPYAQRPPLTSETAEARSAARPPRPLHLSHVAIFTTDVDHALAFYAGVVGLALSDRSGDALAFLHAPHGSDHHVLALVKSAGPGLHHYSWEMGSIDAVGLRATLAAEQGYAAGWGFGRHVLGSNYFHYVRDPWGSHAELTAGIEHIAADCEWRAGDHRAEDAFYLWGPPPPADFIDNPECSPSARQETVAA